MKIPDIRPQDQRVADFGLRTLITQRSLVQIQPPQPIESRRSEGAARFRPFRLSGNSRESAIAAAKLFRPGAAIRSRPFSRTCRRQTHAKLDAANEHAL